MNDHPMHELVALARESSTSGLAAAIHEQQLTDPQSIAEITVAALVTLAGAPRIDTPELLAHLDRIGPRQRVVGRAGPRLSGNPRRWDRSGAACRPNGPDLSAVPEFRRCYRGARCAEVGPPVIDLREHLGNHMPRQPDWHCESDGFDWPCPLARYRLAQAFDHAPGDLAAEMTLWMEAAIVARLTDDPEQLWDRFLAWTPGTDRRQRAAP
ncbi:hypothetical protein JQS43_14290 [Natronosporangium hydrolyticum]|uniref:Uncharacterized protein n=1 Tax=Natronosporangium hydrolyticum TaxID=2811111 RepID=A0A895YC01_9ACTN|nr:hypothetical protein [Natronosporangium hydrolyticum]QSB12849.1 hypothetical protein JQS43_14290 [Natronosporangium hydrolyticum]